MSGLVNRQSGPRVNPNAFSDKVGIAQSSIQIGVIGTNSEAHAFGFLAGDDLVFTQHTGVYGESDQQGVMGIGTEAGATGVFGGCLREGGFGIRGDTQTGVAIQGQAFGTGLAGKFLGNVEISGQLQGGHVQSLGDVEAENMRARQNIVALKVFAFDVVLSGGDCAEDFDIAGLDPVDPGTVMVINGEGTLRPCEVAYDRKVTGVISGAGDYKAGIVLDKQQSTANRLPLALVGKVYCKVDAEFGPVEVGDLLTTSATAGHAMKAHDQTRAFGSVIGKALRAISRGQGLIPILIALQ
jgi:hypothetical protein